MPAAVWAHQRLPRYLTQPETEAFLAAIHSPRDRALFALVYHCGLRVGEVALLTRADVDLARGRILVRRLKGGRWSEQPLFARTLRLIEDHLGPGAEQHPDAPLFTGRKGALKKRQMQALFARYRSAAGLSPRYTCHSLRHSIATHLLDAGMSLEFIQDHLGHQDIRSTSIYARITDRHRAAAFARLESSPWIVQPGGSSASPETGIAPAA